MNRSSNKILLGSTALVLLLAGAVADGPLGIGLVGEANAVFGRPVTPVSFAGVARRTTRRAVVYGSAAAASTAAVAATVSQPQQAAPPPAAPPPAPAPSSGKVPIGTVVTSLPAGCTTVPEGGVQYYQCDGTRYRAAFQGNNLVYVAQ